MSFYIDNNNYCIGRMCLNINKNYCEHVVLNKGVLEIWDIFKIRSDLGHKMSILEDKHFSTNKIGKSTSEQDLELYKIFYKYKY